MSCIASYGVIDLPPDGKSPAFWKWLGTAAIGVIGAITWYFRFDYSRTTFASDVLNRLGRVETDRDELKRRVGTLETQNKTQADQIEGLERQVEEKTYENVVQRFDAALKGVELAEVTIPVRGTMHGRVLLVDDHVDTLRGMMKWLSYHGFRVVGVSTVAAAIAELESDPFDFVFLDLMLPDGTGAGILAHIQAMGLKCHVALSTGCSDERFEAAKQLLGSGRTFVKPIDLNEVLAWMGKP